MKVAFKDSVRVNPLVHFERPVRDMFWALIETAPALVGDTLYITSANDSRHSSAASLHYKDRALDVRILGDRTGGIRFAPGLVAGAAQHDQLNKAGQWVQRLRAKLGRDFDVVLESDHIHLEHDPE